jgi:hypothetical protein
MNIPERMRSGSFQPRLEPPKPSKAPSIDESELRTYWEVCFVLPLADHAARQKAGLFDPFVGAQPTIPTQLWPGGIV